MLVLLAVLGLAVLLAAGLRFSLCGLSSLENILVRLPALSVAPFSGREKDMVLIGRPGGAGAGRGWMYRVGVGMGFT